MQETTFDTHFLFNRRNVSHAKEITLGQLIKSWNYHTINAIKFTIITSIFL